MNRCYDYHVARSLFPAHAGMNLIRHATERAPRLFPAHAGMNLNTFRSLTRMLPVPRTRGDEPKN